MKNKGKIVNDPVFGFINIPAGFIYDIIQHPFLQRLNRIRQLGLTSVVYPGAQHTRFHHSLGAMHLMTEAIMQLRAKGNTITQEEEDAVLACILLHDIGHGPFSHALEHTLIRNLNHEKISLMLMEEMNVAFNSQLDVAIQIFKNEYPKHFLHQLVSGQLDMDRLDYLRRDSFFTGVSEGNIGSARIIKMLNIHDDRLVVESKGIYSIENFLMARRLMYWQVYLHKTSLAAEKMLINILQRAKELAVGGDTLFASPALHFFLYRNVCGENFDKEALEHFSQLDDNDIWCALKVWASHPDFVLSRLSESLVNRQLFKIEISTQPVKKNRITSLKNIFAEKFNISKQEASYFIASDCISTNMYNEADDSIDIIYNTGEIKDISEASDMLNISLLSKNIKKYYCCFLRYSK
ncbi:MAG: HD domain-containing protein [Dysgonamonadaceae bacterium]|jgi:HD superfamily phosphohydrolase|nr:HD domain-containing protein [Dysgonamonadaceae bacterium]